MTAPSVAGFCIVRNATLLDFPFEASVASVLPGVDEFVLAVGRSDDDTLARARAITDTRIRIIESEWDTSIGSAVLSVETNRAMAACRARWGICIQADEVLADGGAETLRRLIDATDSDARVEGLLVDYLHFYGSFDRLGTSRRWYRRETRAIRLDAGVHAHGDAQGFRVGAEGRKIRCRESGVAMYHYGWARPIAALQRKRAHDRTIYDTERAKDADRPLLPWEPGLRPFRGTHPVAAADWIAARRAASAAIEPRPLQRADLAVGLSLLVERITGWRPFEFRNYTRVG